MNQQRTPQAQPQRPAPAKGQELAIANKPLVETFAARYGIDANKMLETLRDTVFSPGKDRATGKPNAPVTNAEMAALLVVANEYHLNPFTKEIYAFRNKAGGITPIVGYDGWVRLVQSQPQFDGEDLELGFDERPVTIYDAAGQPVGTEPRGMFYECTMYRKDRSHPTKVREYLRENWRDTEPWNQMPNRMTRMRAYIQAARICFGFGGIYDEDEGMKIAVRESSQDLLPMTPRADPRAPQPRTDVEALATDDQIEHLKEQLAKTGVPDNAFFARFEIGDFEELKFNQVQDAIAWINEAAAG